MHVTLPWAMKARFASINFAAMLWKSKALKLAIKVIANDKSQVTSSTEWIHVAMSTIKKSQLPYV